MTRSVPVFQWAREEVANPDRGLLAMASVYVQAFGWRQTVAAVVAP